MSELRVDRPGTPSETLIQVSSALYELSELVRNYEQPEALAIDNLLACLASVAELGVSEGEGKADGEVEIDSSIPHHPESTPITEVISDASL